jgi:hypothetical protein
MEARDVGGAEFSDIKHDKMKLRIKEWWQSFDNVLTGSEVRKYNLWLGGQ